MLFSFLWTISACTKENRQHTNTLQPSNWIMGHNKPEVLKNISLVTYCSSQYGGFKLFVSNIGFADAKFFHNFVFTCLFMATGSFFIASLVYLQYKFHNFVFTCLFMAAGSIFYHILGIFAVQVSLVAFVLYVAITLRIRNWVNWQQNFHYWRS